MKIKQQKNKKEADVVNTLKRKNNVPDENGVHCMKCDTWKKQKRETISPKNHHRSRSDFSTNGTENEELI
jgi:hypothetical protein